MNIDFRDLEIEEYINELPFNNHLVINLNKHKSKKNICYIM